MKKVLFFIIVFSFLSFYSEGEVYLDLEKVSKIALKNNLDIKMIEFDIKAKDQDLKEVNSMFDTFLNLNVSYNKDEKDTASTIFGTRNLNNTYSLGIKKKIPLGTNFEINAINERKWTNSTFITQNPYTEAKVKFSLTQPLGKNFFGVNDRRKVRLTKLEIENKNYLYLDSMEEILAKIQKAYWYLVFRKEELKIKKDMLKEAENLYSIYKEKFKNGLAEKTDLLATEANLFLRKNDYLEAKLLLEEARNNLFYLLNLSKEEEIVVLDSLNREIKELNFYRELNEAIKKRRDYKIVKNRVSQQKLNLSLKKNSLWPEIDLISSFSKNGIDSYYKNAWKEISSSDYHEWFVGLKFSISLERRKESSEYEKAKLNKAKLLILLKKVEYSIFKEIKNLINKLNTLYNQIKICRKVVKIQEDKLKKEKEKLKYGRSSSDTIIRFEENLLKAKLNLIYTLFSYQLTLIDLERCKNNLLSKYTT
jgi:outer membrane protein TolC